MRFGNFIDIPYHWRISLLISAIEMNKKQLIFPPVLRHMSGNSKGRLLGKDSAAGSQEPQQGGQGKALSDKDTVPCHLNKKESSQGQLTHQWLPDEAAITGQIWGQARKMFNKARPEEMGITRHCPTHQGKAVVNEAGVIWAAPCVLPAQAAKPLGEQGMHSGPWHNTTFQGLIELPPASFFHSWWWLCRILKSWCQIFYEKKAKTEMTGMANTNCFTDLTDFGITRIICVGNYHFPYYSHRKSHCEKNVHSPLTENYYWVWRVHCININDSRKNAQFEKWYLEHTFLAISQY